METDFCLTDSRTVCALAFASRKSRMGFSFAVAKSTSGACVADRFAGQRKPDAVRYVHHTPKEAQAAGRINPEGKYRHDTISCQGRTVIPDVQTFRCTAPLDRHSGHRAAANPESRNRLATSHWRPGFRVRADARPGMTPRWARRRATNRASVALTPP